MLAPVEAETRTTAPAQDRKGFFPPDLTVKKKGIAKTYQNNRKFLLQLAGIRHGHLQGHDVVFHLGLAVHAFYVSHLQVEEKKKKVHSPPTFFSPPAKLEIQNSPIIQTV